MAAQSKTKSNKIGAVQQQTIDTINKIKLYKVQCEANIVSILWKDPELYAEYDDLTLDKFSNNIWKVYWNIGYGIIIREQKQSLDDITVGLYLEKHSRLKERYDEYGGYEQIIKTQEFVKRENIDGYIKEFNKWNIVLDLAKLNFPILDRLSDFADMTSEDIYSEYETKLNHVFITVDNNLVSYNISDGIDELIEELNEGLAVGLEYSNMPMLTRETGGQLIGNITLIGGLSNVGKTTLARNSILPSIIHKDEKIVVMLNEDGLKKWSRECLVWIANNIYKKDLQKYTVRDGKYSDEVKELLYKCAKWLKEKTVNHNITIIPFKTYKTQLAIKVIKKYASLGAKYFLLDTFKADQGTTSDSFWFDMQQSMVSIYDVIKPDAKNLHIAITFQLSKGSAKQRYYTSDNIGVSKNIVDVASTCIMIRDLLTDEMNGEKNALQVYRLAGVNGKSKIPVELDKDKHYQILFIIKNREGSANQYQIVAEHDMSRNILKEVGICNVSVDF